jgi:uncharacterized protein YecE (DUF72 family)
MDPERPSAIHIGTSGWHYDHWVGPFYSKRLPKKKFLEYYADRFKTEEINNSFYRLPLQRTFENWRDQVPVGFVFSVKASRFITHMKKLKDPEPSVEAFFQRVKGLGNKLGPILFQLPPRWRFDRGRLEGFLNALPVDHKYAFEFRDPSWLNPEVFDMLSQLGMALCMYDFGHMSAPKEVTADFVYIRLHGPEGPYEGNYSSRELQCWAADIKKWSEDGTEVFCYFDNDQFGYAPLNAGQLLAMVEELSLR